MINLQNMFKPPTPLDNASWNVFMLLALKIKIQIKHEKTLKHKILYGGGILIDFPYILSSTQFPNKFVFYVELSP